MENVQERLKGLAGKAAGNTSAPAEETAKTTTEFTSDTGAEAKKQGVPKDAEGRPYIKDKTTGEYRERTADEKAKWDAMQATKTTKDQICKDLTAKSNAKLSATAREVRQAIQDTSRIVAYIVAKSEKVDFAAKSKSTNSQDNLDANGKVIDPTRTVKTYTIGLKNFAPSNIKAVAIRVHPGMIELLNQIGTKSDAEIVTELTKLKQNTSDVSKVIFVAYAELVAWVKTHTMGYLFEDDAIFTPFSKGKGENVKTYNAPADIKPGHNLPEGSYLYLSTKLTKMKHRTEKKDGATTVTSDIETKNVTTLKHSARAKLLTPDNCVPISRYQTITPQDSYSEADAKRMIQLYMGQFMKTTDKRPKATIESLESYDAFTVAERDITATSYFPVAGATSWKATSTGIEHWSKKTATGDPVMIAPANIRLVKKAFAGDLQEDAKSPEKVVTVADELGAADTDAAYKFDAATFGKVITAGQNMLDAKTIVSEAKSKKNAKKSSSKKSEAKVTFVDPSAILGLSDEEIATTIAAKLGFAK